jgi:hypothetical protein
MELANIEKLLKKYLNAETSIAEENTLKEYFLSDNVAPHLQEYEALFSYFAVSKQERYTKTIQLKSQKRNWKWLSVAASVVLLFSVYSGYNSYQKKRANEIYAQSMEQFALLSQNLNKGTMALNHLQHLESTTNKIFKQPKEN